MRRIHIAQVETDAERLTPLVAAARALGLSVGWLDWSAPDDEPPAGLVPAPAAGFAATGRIVAGATVIARRRRGPASLRDVLRQGFLGCHLVLVRGKLVGFPTVEPRPGGCVLVLPGGGRRELDADAFAALLRRPHPWPQPPC